MTRIAVHDPTRPTVEVGSVEAATAAGVDAVVRAAAAAQPAWRDVGVAARAAALARVADLLAADADSIGAVLCAELGKPLADARGEVAFAAAFLRDCAARAERVLAPTEVDDAAGRLRTTREPYGVCAGIVPWNAPIILAALKLGPALVAGNAIVLKPSPLAPLALEQAVRVIGAAFPADLLAVVHGDAEPGQALVAHPLVRKVAFTGGEAVGVRVAEVAAAGIKPVLLELGGNDAAIFLDDADLDRPGAVDGAVLGAFLMGGQVCMAAKRLYVHRSIADRFLDAFLDAARRILVVGDPMQPETTVGPMISAAAAERQQRIVAAAVEAGGTVHLACRSAVVHHDVEGGHFAHPVLVTGLGDDAPLVAEEQFGPTLPLLVFDDDDEVVRRANASALGLGASVWSADEDRAFALADRLEAGMVFVGCHNRAGMTLRAPFGGWKRSGHGREYGDEGLLGHTQTRTTHAPASVRAGGTPEGSRYPT